MEGEILGENSLTSNSENRHGVSRAVQIMYREQFLIVAIILSWTLFY